MLRKRHYKKIDFGKEVYYKDKIFITGDTYKSVNGFNYVILCKNELPDLEFCAKISDIYTYIIPKGYVLWTCHCGKKELVKEHIVHAKKHCKECSLEIRIKSSRECNRKRYGRNKE